MSIKTLALVLLCCIAVVSTFPSGSQDLKPAGGDPVNSVAAVAKIEAVDFDYVSDDKVKRSAEYLDSDAETDLVREKRAHGYHSHHHHHPGGHRGDGYYHGNHHYQGYGQQNNW